MWANNETGALHDVAAIGKLCAAHGVPFHVDAVQVGGKLALDVSKLAIDSLSLSAHKLHGPKGIGALYLRDSAGFAPLLRGGGQESERRAGTENIPAIVGFARAADASLRWMQAGGPAQLASLRDSLEARITAGLSGSRVHAASVARTCNTSNLGFDGVSGEALVLLLSEEGICASAGSACASSRHAPSHVLLAMGLGERAASSSLRLSLSRETTAAEVDQAVEAVIRAVSTLRALGD
jgi:cysteine desulfurase